MLFGRLRNVNLPRVMLARSGPEGVSFLTTGKLKPTPVAESAHGICTQPLQAEACSGVSGASEAPKSTVRAVIWAIPVPEPTAPYLTPTLFLLWKSRLHLAISGATSVDPAPTSESLWAMALDVTPPAPSVSAPRVTAKILL